MPKLFRPPPPKTTGLKSLVIFFTLFGWGGYTVWQALNSSKPDKPLSSVRPTPTPGPAFVEVDLRGPFYDQGRYAGYEDGLAAAEKDFALPADAVLAYQGTKAIPNAAMAEKNDREDFVAGYGSGYAQGWKKNREKIASAQAVK